MRSFDTFRGVLAAVPMIGGFLPQNQPGYNPEKPLAESLGELSVNLADMPATFEEMSVNMDKADNNLDAIKANLNTMSDSVAMISSSIGEYRDMLGESQASMENVRGLLTNVQTNLPNYINISSIVLGAFFLWLLAAQVVIFSQGWELFQGTAGRMESGERTETKAETASAD
jgi:hypothetical protein